MHAGGGPQLDVSRSVRGKRPTNRFGPSSTTTSDRCLYPTLSCRPHTAHQRPFTDLLRTPVNLNRGLGFDGCDHSVSPASAPPASWL